MNRSTNRDTKDTTTITITLGDSAVAAHAAPKARTSRKVAKPQKVGFSISGTPQTTAMPM